MKALRNPESIMKIPAHWLAIGVMALSLGITGCKHEPQRLTNIGGTGPGQIPDDKGNVLGNAPRTGDSTLVTPTPPRETDTGHPAAPGDWDNPDKWTQNPGEFKDQTVYFDFDKVNVRPSEVGKLKDVARRMKTFRNKALYIQGHCDERGTEEYNRSLGDRRALSIREFLVKEGLDPNMMPTISFGEDKPVEPGHNEAAWSKNRRGEMILLTPR